MSAFEALNTNQRTTWFNLFSETRHWLPNQDGTNSRSRRRGSIKILLPALKEIEACKNYSL
jgi:hypothetical protein